MNNKKSNKNIEKIMKENFKNMKETMHTSLSKEFLDCNPMEYVKNVFGIKDDQMVNEILSLYQYILDELSKTKPKKSMEEMFVLYANHMDNFRHKGDKKSHDVIQYVLYLLATQSIMPILLSNYGYKTIEIGGRIYWMTEKELNNDYFLIDMFD